jgi:uncharacterized protein DUF72
MKPHDFFSYYAKQFKTVEIDSTYYGTPSAPTVMNWHERTPGTTGHPGKKIGGTSVLAMPVGPRDRKFTTGML